MRARASSLDMPRPASRSRRTSSGASTTTTVSYCPCRDRSRRALPCQARRYGARRAAAMLVGDFGVDRRMRDGIEVRERISDRGRPSAASLASIDMTVGDGGSLAEAVDDLARKARPCGSITCRPKPSQSTTNGTERTEHSPRRSTCPSRCRR